MGNSDCPWVLQLGRVKWGHFLKVTFHYVDFGTAIGKKKVYQITAENPNKRHRKKHYDLNVSPQIYQESGGLIHNVTVLNGGPLKGD